MDKKFPTLVVVTFPNDGWPNANGDVISPEAFAKAGASLVGKPVTRFGHRISRVTDVLQEETRSLLTLRLDDDTPHE